MSEKQDKRNRSTSGVSSHLSSAYQAGVRLARLMFLVLFAILSGIPAAAAEISIEAAAVQFAKSIGWAGTLNGVAFSAGLETGVGVIIFVLTTLLVPLGWRLISNPSWLRAITYVAIQAYAIAFGLLIVPIDFGGSSIALAIAGAGSVGWWRWQKKWRGSGVAPSPLAGFLKPDIQSGQIWYAIVSGSHETKVRPVIIVGPKPDTDGEEWVTAYFTTQEPRPHLAQYYLEVPAGDLRGLPKQNWVSLRDPRELRRRQLRSYTGLAPKWLYTQVCAELGVAQDPHARTVNEEHAGESDGPLERALHKFLMLRPGDMFGDEDQSETLKALLKMEVIPPLRSGKKRPSPKRDDTTANTVEKPAREEE